MAAMQKDRPCGRSFWLKSACNFMGYRVKLPWKQSICSTAFSTRRGTSEMIQAFLNRWILTPNRRYRLVTALSFGFLFLIPLLGWNPILILLSVNACLAYKETKGSEIRFFHGIMIVLCFILIVSNLCARMIAMLQYWGHLT